MAEPSKIYGAGQALRELSRSDGGRLQLEQIRAYIAYFTDNPGLGLDEVKQALLADPSASAIDGSDNRLWESQTLGDD